MIRGLLGFVFEIALLISLGTVGFNQIYHETKMAALEKVEKGTVSLTTLTEKLTGRKSWLETPTTKNILHGIGNWD